MAQVESGSVTVSGMSTKLRMTYTSGGGSITITQIEGWVSIGSGGAAGIYDQYTGGTQTVSIPGGSGSFTTTKGSAGAAGVGINFGQNGWRAWGTDPASITISGSGSGNVSITLTAGSGTGLTGKTYTFSNIDIGSSVTTPTINNPSMSNIGRTTADSSFTVASDGGAAIVDHYIDCGTYNFGNVVSTISSSSGTFTGLTPLTTYYVRANASNGTYRGYSGVISFTTTANKPSNLSITNTGKTYNSISVSVSATGDTNAPITNYTLYYKKSSAGSYTSINLGTGTTRTITGLEDNTTYNIYFTATNVVGTTQSSVINVTTIQGRAVVLSNNGGAFARRRLYISVNGGSFKLITRPGLHVYINGSRKL